MSTIIAELFKKDRFERRPLDGAKKNNLKNKVIFLYPPTRLFPMFEPL